jgi:hypothetical protein
VPTTPLSFKFQISNPNVPTSPSTSQFSNLKPSTNGDLEHRLLFSAGIEMQIVFRAFELKWKDAE